MKISFHIHYKTTSNEQLHAVFTLGIKKLDVPLSSKDGIVWTGETTLPVPRLLQLNYHYEVYRDRKFFRKEWDCIPRQLLMSPAFQTYELHDTWRDLPDQAYLYSSAVTEVLQKRHLYDGNWTPCAQTMILKVQTPRSHAKRELFLCGEGAALGNWDLRNALQLKEIVPNEWAVALDVANLVPKAAYKFFLRENDEIFWEEGKNRTLPDVHLENQTCFIQSDLRPKFKDPSPLRAAGVILPVFSLRSEESWGVGDFGDLIKLIDWVKLTGQKVIQILPVNDTSATYTWRDSCPQNIISVYALNPIYADMRSLPGAINQQWEIRRRAINVFPRVDYEESLSFKLSRLRAAFQADGKNVLSSPGFKRFFEQQLHWLPAYAMFCVLRDTYRTANFRSWPKFSKFSYRQVADFCKVDSPHYQEVTFWYYVQYTLHTQLLKAAQYARQNGIILCCDIPVGVSPYSVEAWQEPRAFNINVQAGAPPDHFSASGRNWGVATYNWEQMEKNDYRWWKRRLAHLADYFDAYCLEHLLGFFRIWEIPSHSIQGLLGHFSPSLPMSASEISCFGLPFRMDFLRPLITEEYLKETLGKKAEEAKQRFLLPYGHNMYRFRQEYDTQRKIEMTFAAEEENELLEEDEKEERNTFKKGLFALLSNVLFVEDNKQPARYHPRINALKDGFFKTLSVAEQKAFTNLYNDYFYVRHNQFWAEQALKKLSVLTQSTRMMACAEDLGMRPLGEPEIVKRLQLLPIEIERMPQKEGESFSDPQQYPYASVATPSTPDMSVVREWWMENPALTHKLWTEILGKSDPAPAEADSEICTEIIWQHYQSPSMLVLIAWQDLCGISESLWEANPEEERINLPSDPYHYWRYRMQVTLEELMEKTAFNMRIKQLISESDR